MHHLLVQLKEPTRWHSCKQHQNVDWESTKNSPWYCLLPNSLPDFFCCCCTPSCFPDVSYHVSSLLRFFFLEITNPSRGLQFERFCLLFAILGEYIHCVRCLRSLQAANFPVRTHLQRHRQKLQSAALQYRISGVTESVRRGFTLRPAVAGCVGKRQCVGDVCARCYHWAHTNLSRSGSRFLSHTLIETWPIVTDWRADTCPFERRHCGNGSHSAAPQNFTKTNSGLGGLPTLMRNLAGLLFHEVRRVTRRCREALSPLCNYTMTTTYWAHYLSWWRVVFFFFLR